MLVDFDYILNSDKKEVKVFSLGYLFDRIILTNNLSKSQRGKLKNFFDNFYFTHKDIEYYEINNKILIDYKYLTKIKNEIKNQFNNIYLPEIKIKIINTKSSEFKKITINEILEKEKQKQKIKLQKQQEEIENRKKELKELFELIENGRVIIFDMEFWEKNMYKILEVAYGEIDKNLKFKFLNHYVVKDNLNFRNFRFVKDNRFKKDIRKEIKLNFKIMYQKDIFDEFKSLLNKIDGIIIHGPENDLKVLKRYGIEIDKKIFDTSKLGIFIDEQYIKNNRISLDLIAGFLNRNSMNLHNAANDIDVICDLLELLKRRING